MDPKQLESHVRELARQPRTAGGPEHARAADYIRSALEGAGWTVREQRFHEAGELGRNLIAERTAGEARPLLVVGAHYDSVPWSPGADDNASAVAALIELARRLPAFPVDANPLWLVAFDQEESGMLGSRALVESLLREHRGVAGMVSLEMLGYADSRPGSQRLPPPLRGLYPDVGNFIGVVGNEASRAFTQRWTDGMKRARSVDVQMLVVPGRGERIGETRLSDHSPFWDAGLPALMVTDTSFHRNPHYHEESDTPDTLDYDFLARVTLAVERAILDFPEPDVAFRD